MTDNEKRYLALVKEEEAEEELVDITQDEGFIPEEHLLIKEDKAYWIYELPMMRSFFLLAEVWRVLGISAFIVLAFSYLVTLLSGDGLDALIGISDAIGLTMAILFVLSIPAYYIVTKANNDKYTVLFEMDDKGIDHIQIKSDKAQALDILISLAGRLTNNRTLAGIGGINASGASLYTSFEKVRKIRADKDKHLIRLNTLFMRNQIYVDDEAFDYVYDFIKQRCPNAKEE